MKGCITARYPGRCPACREPIEPGDDLRQDEDDAWVHRRCSTPDRAQYLHAIPEAICPECHMARPCWCVGED